MWKTIGGNIAKYKGYPRIVGETGGKDFIFAHPSADPVALATAMVRGAFEFQGQKCSAASRAYIPKSIWPKVKEHLLGQVSEIKMGPPTDFRNFFSAVIDKGAFKDHKGYIDFAKSCPECTILAGGGCDDSVGYFIQPTVVQTTDPKCKMMEEEIFGPVLTLYVYDDAKLDETLELCDTTSPYALTGAVFAQDREGHRAHGFNRLRNAAGNFYINDKPTGAVVGQQPFGGGRASGTNDKAGSYLNLIRWTTMRAIKETFVPPDALRVPLHGGGIENLTTENTEKHTGQARKEEITTKAQKPQRKNVAQSKRARRLPGLFFLSAWIRQLVGAVFPRLQRQPERSWLALQGLMDCGISAPAEVVP